MVKDTETGEIVTQEYEKSYKSGDQYTTTSATSPFDQIWEEEFAEQQELYKDFDEYFSTKWFYLIFVNQIELQFRCFTIYYFAGFGDWVFVSNRGWHCNYSGQWKENSRDGWGVQACISPIKFENEM